MQIQCSCGQVIKGRTKAGLRDAMERHRMLHHKEGG